MFWCSLRRAVGTRLLIFTLLPPVGQTTSPARREFYNG
jgi:hypothetical protein